jgi:hypothetical protein
LPEERRRHTWARERALVFLREEEKSELAHPSCGTLFFTRLSVQQAAGLLERKWGFLGRWKF